VRFTGRQGLGAAVLLAVWVTGVPASTERPDGDPTATIAGSFVFPVGDETDYARAHSGEASGFYVSDEYLARRGRKRQRTHYGVDLACGRGGSPVRASASGVVVVADGNALIQVRKKERVRTPVVVDGKKTYKTTTRTRTVYKWRTGWGNYVVVRHTLPSGETVFSLYAHLMPKSVLVKRGDVVAAGQQIGRVGRTGRASSSHLHFEIRKSVPASPDQQSDEFLEEDERTPEEVTYTQLSTVDPLEFLDDHVRRFDDLEPGTWQARYAYAACRDGILGSDEKRFAPDKPVTREDYYRLLIAAFRLATPFTTKTWGSAVDALVDAQVLDRQSARGQRPDDKISGSDALEMMLRCLDRQEARASTMAGIEGMQVSLDFNTRFAGVEAAAAAQSQARTAATTETKARQKAEYARVARAQKAAKAAGKTSRAKVKKVKAVPPTPLLDPGFEALAQSGKELTRAEACLLLATALRLGAERVSGLQRAATRVVDQG
jgi:murein DD-endopeptidase MepM/ murein hydrolase activator NlpD